MNYIIGLAAGYLVGSIPTAYLFGRLLKGIDIREHGSGNVGATNAFRVLGKGWGTLVLLLDIVKGIIPVTLIGDACQLTSLGGRLLLAVVAVCGHNWTVFLQFKGGKGVATSLGVLIGLTISFPSLGPVLLVCLLCWLVVFIISGYVSLASVIAGAALPVTMLLTGQPPAMLALGAAFAFFIIYRHRPNIRRLIKGEESRVKFPFHKSS